ncbi:beta-glucuronidase isoform X2 [Drosophila serrata]|uniref:beta-glucuronidase isoform X2 n=1 Tax=Drosophila serrata TaxID=7274 RepID=UPI000A1CF592|nr:beta-glucuronidase isoform X2 [Drosophila serrata]
MRWHGPSFTWFLVLPLFLLQVFTTGEGIPESLDANKEWPLFEYGEIKKPTPTKGLLYPRESETREVRSLDGMWRLVKSNPKDPLQGVREKWFANSLRMSGRKVIPMPVPASYNDIATTDSLRDHVGTVWYERTFFVSRLWQRSVRTWLRFGSVHYSALVWINGKNATSHSIGHLPFEADISGLLDFGGENRITVMCDNRLGNRTIPQGSVYQAVTDKGPVPVQSYTFDFFNYAGIHRSVHLYTTPLLHISDLELFIASNKEEDGSALQDAYRLPVGIRTLSWNNQSLLLNGVPIYLRGFGRHEDSDIRGKGLDNALLARDFNLLQWIGANAYRTSHYPYSEESMQFADEQGIMIIDECPAVNIDIFEPQLLEQHMSSLEQLIHRDRNHPSVVAWSVANEPRSTKQGALKYFEALVNYTQSIAQGRPLTAAINASPSTCHLAQFLDIVGFNRYNSWYQNSGRTDMIVDLLTKEAQSWRDKFGKPVIQFEYGGDTMEGMHSLPAFIWSEEYQVQLFSKHFRAFDDLREKLWFIGEFVWNFADFRTAQTITRVGGNKKGVFTRNRQPKEVAHILRKRYYAIAHELDRCTLPEDLTVYISREYRHNRHNEL